MVYLWKYSPWNFFFYGIVFNVRFSLNRRRKYSLGEGQRCRTLKSAFTEILESTLTKMLVFQEILKYQSYL